MNLDDIWAMVGDFGRFQKWALVHWLVLALLTGMQCMVYVIITVTPPFRCFVPGCDNDSSPFDHVIFNTSDHRSSVEGCRSLSTVDDIFCDVDVIVPSTGGEATPCNRWIYDRSGHVISTVTKWDLVCDSANLVPLIQSMMMLGMIFGSVIFGYVADRFGRKSCAFAAISIASVIFALYPVVPPFSAFLALRFMNGAGCMGAYLVAWSYVLEITGAKQRLLVCVALNLAFACGEALVGFIGYFIHDWSVVVWIILALCVVWLAILCWFCESPRWLITSRKFDKCQKAFEQIAKVNGKEIDLSAIKFDQLETVAEREEQHHYTTLDLFRSPKLRWLTINVAFNWLTNTLSYYGISMALPSISGNEAVDLIIVSLIEIPSYLFNFLTLNKFGRKLPLVANLILGGIAGICTAPVALVPDLQWLLFTLVLLAKFCCASAFANLLLFTNELFPTVLRSNGGGVCSMMGHVGAVLSPYVAQLKLFHPPLPMIIFGCFSLVSGVAAITLTETAGERLPDNIEDIEGYPDSRTNCEHFWRMFFCRRKKGTLHDVSTEIDGVFRPRSQ